MCITVKAAIMSAMLVAASGFVLAQENAEMPWAVSGAGGAYLLAQPGELEIEVFKRDLNISGSRGTIVRALLAGPDREVLDEVLIPSSGGAAGDPPGPVQSATLRTQVERPGIYALNMHIVGDRYGLNLEWGIETNAAAWLIETARGHRDERHREPIVMNDAERSADVNFLPRAGEFEIEIEALPADSPPLILYDADGSEIARMPVAAQQSTSIRERMRVRPGEQPEGSVQFTVPADEARGDRPWRLHLPQAQAFIEIDGLNRWDSTDLYRDQCVWTPVADSWFDWLQNRWMISPYQRTVYLAPGDRAEMAFTLHNNSPTEREIDLALEMPAGPWAVELADRTVTLPARSGTEISLSFEAPADGETRIGHLRVTPRETPDVTTYATLTVRGGASPVGEPLDLPLELKPYSHENRQFGYLPEYAVDQDIYFDLESRGFVNGWAMLHREVDGEWVTTNLSDSVVRVVPEVEAATWSAIGSKVAFDADNNVYLIARSGPTAALLRSTDGGESFTAYVIPGREDEPRGWDIEQFSGHNVPPGPPPVVRVTRTHQDETAGLRWRNMNDLDLFVAEVSADGELEFHEPVRLTEMALASAMHSGAPSMLVSRGTKVHAVWGEATDPGISRDEIPGVPAYVATYDIETRTLSAPVFMSHGAPPNDMHNTPSITMDSEGYLHVVVGTHGRPFQYLRSLEPNDASSGWTEPVRTSERDLSQTYVGLVCGADNSLHLVYRLALSGEERGYGAGWTALTYQRMTQGGDWEEPVLLVTPPFSEYSVYYHRLTAGRDGDLFVSYDYWSTMWFYRNDQRGAVAAGSGRPGRGWGRAVLTSGDGGDQWSLW